MQAKFIGENSSMGFRTGVTYNIRIERKMIKRNKQPISCLYLYDVNSGLWCPYESLEAVLRNWEIVK